MTRRSMAAQPQVVSERKPLRPVHVTATRQPVKVTMPIVLGGEPVTARALPGKKVR